MEENLNLSEQERARIRAEMRYAMLVTQEAPSAEKPKSAIGVVLGYLSNGFIILIIGSLITTWLVPRFQRQYEARTQQVNLMQECLSQFLLYSNSIWQEYYTILPLTQEAEINKDEYLKYLNGIAEIKLKRYNSFAKVEALSIVFREDADNKPSPEEEALKNYAIRLNTASDAIDKWLTALYCTPTEREYSPCASFDPTFDAFSEYKKIQDLVLRIGNEDSDEVAAQLVRRISKNN